MQAELLLVRFAVIALVVAVVWLASRVWFVQRPI
jgi:hypothetical protein